MKLAVSEPVAAPPERVFATLADFEAMIPRLGGGALRLTPDPAANGHPAWQAELDLNGIVRQGHARVTDIRPPSGYAIEAVFDQAMATLAIDVTTLDAPAEDGALSRIDATVNLTPRGIAGRVLLQPLKLMQSGIRERLSARLARLARDIEAAEARRS